MATGETSQAKDGWTEPVNQETATANWLAFGRSVGGSMGRTGQGGSAVQVMCKLQSAEQCATRWIPCGRGRGHDMMRRCTCRRLLAGRSVSTHVAVVGRLLTAIKQALCSTDAANKSANTVFVVREKKYCNVTDKQFNRTGLISSI